MKKTTVEIPDALMEEARAYAHRHGVTLRYVFEEGVRYMIDKDQEPKKPFKLKKVSVKGEGPAVLPPWDELREIIYEGRGG
jgi:hypothetical protein